MIAERLLRRSLLALGAIAASLLPVRAAEPAFSADDLAFFDAKVKPVLLANCLKCHGGENPKGKLLLATRGGVLKGGQNGSVVNLEKPEESRLLKAIDYKSDALKMPPPGRIAQGDIDVLAKWVQRGLPMKSLEAEVAALHQTRGGVITEESRNYWAYKPVKRPEPPKVRGGAWVRNPIDAFILAKLEDKGLTAAPPVDRTALVRRIYYDLIGLPPTPEQIDRFVNDQSPGAYEKLIDQLLQSPHYGEKWGRHWLDLVRYAETNGNERDGPKPFAWRYRDYVVKSLNEDKPFYRFVREQLAGDEIDRDSADAVTATGYYRLGIWDDEPADPLQARYEEFDDWVATTAQVFLGMTMNCARCHDHKIDPIPQADYYRLLAFFQDVHRYSDNRDVKSSFNLSDISPAAVRKTYEAELRKLESRKAEVGDAMKQIEDEAIKKMPAIDQRATETGERAAVLARKLNEFLTPAQAEDYRKLRRQMNELRARPEPGRDLALSVNNCEVHPSQTFVMTRGNPHSPAAKVDPGFPRVLGFADPKIPPAAPGARSSGRRMVLADWIASPNNPVTARVFVNRLWQHHFGRGIVASSNDFGKFGTLPTHPELLDWLATEFVRLGWKIKPMHKLIMMSNAYQMSAKASAPGLAADPGNSLFWRFNMRRLSAEEVRDSFLFVTGKLNLKVGGPSVFPKIPKEVFAGQSRPGEGWPTSPAAEANRRSIYVFVKRSLQVPVLAQHDQADTDSSCPVRYTTTVPTQALGLLNGEFGNDTAAVFAERLKKDANDLPGQVRRAIRLTTGRMPGDDEVTRDLAFLVELRKKLSESEALRKYCLMILSANEFVYVD
jgi:hypothetical protein